MPPLLDPNDVYAADRPNALSAAVANDLNLVYVPNNGSDTVSVIDPKTYKVIRTVSVPFSPEHVVPSWDLRTLWVNSDRGNALTPIDPATGQFGKPMQVNDPYNLYFTPDGKYADRHVRGGPRDRVPGRAHHGDPQDRAGHSATGSTTPTSPRTAGTSSPAASSPATCSRWTPRTRRSSATLHLPMNHAMPQDVKISPDGKTWYIADMQTSGIWILNGDTFTNPSFMPTGDGAHGLYVSRDSKVMYIANRGEGSVSVLDFATNTLIAKWHIPGGGSPDMGGLSADGKVLWLSGRYHGVVYAIDTTDGHLLAKIQVGTEPHGLAIWPQPGRYSLGPHRHPPLTRFHDPTVCTMPWTVRACQDHALVHYGRWIGDPAVPATAPAGPVAHLRGPGRVARRLRRVVGRRPAAHRRQHVDRPSRDPVEEDRQAHREEQHNRQLELPVGPDRRRVRSADPSGESRAGLLVGVQRPRRPRRCAFRSRRRTPGISTGW